MQTAAAYIRLAEQQLRMANQAPGPDAKAQHRANAMAYDRLARKAAAGRAAA